MTGLGERAFRWLLRLYPREFRDRYGRDLMDFFREDRGHAKYGAGPLRPVRFWVATIRDLVRTAMSRRKLARTQVVRASRPWTTRVASLQWPQRRATVSFQDVPHAWRYLSRRPGFSAAVMITVGLGVAATTSVFSVANALILRPLPFASADRLVSLDEEEDVQGFSGSLAVGNLDDYCRVPAFEMCAAYSLSDANLAGDDYPRRVRAATVTLRFFATFGVEPLEGRLFSPSDLAAPSGAVIVSAAATGTLGFEGSTVGHRLLIDGAPSEVVGVVPAMPGFDEVAIWRIIGSAGQSRTSHSFRGVAKRRSGVSLEVTSQELGVVSRQLQQQEPRTNGHWWGHVRPLQESMAARFSGALATLSALATVLLLLCTTSAANLVAGRAGGRQRELSVRLALGADGRRLITQLFVESFVLAVAGSVIGLFLAGWALRAVTAILPSNAVLWRVPSLDGRTVAFAVGTAIATSLIFGLLPAVSLSRRTTAAAVRAGRGSVGTGRRLRSILVATQACLATVLLMAATLLGSALLRVLAVDFGFRTDDVVVFSVAAPRSAYADNTSVVAFFDGLTTAISRLPGIDGMGAVGNLPMAGIQTQRGTIRADDPLPTDASDHLVLAQVSTPGYLNALGLRLVDGRDFANNDTATSQPVALVNRRLANALWPDTRAVGQQLLVFTNERVPRLVVGVVADSRQASIDNPVEPEYYAPLRQSPRRTMTYVVHSRETTTRAELQAAVASVDRSVPVYDVATMDRLVNDSSASRRAMTRLAVLFGGVAVSLAAAGLFGLIALGVADRTREIGVRLALGASTRRILSLVVGSGFRMTSIGTGLGLLAIVPVHRALLGVLGAVEPITNWQAAGACAATLAAAGILAAWVPARTALRVDPAVSLRAD